jgi:two-component system, OmpR family, response regulator MtrA
MASARCQYAGPVNERVLLVEDDPSIREVVELGLEQAGFRVTAAGDGADGLAEFRSRRYDAVLLDLMLPSMDGYDVCRRIRESSQVPIVMLTARTDTVDVVVGLELGADDYLTKPFELPELVARLRAVLRRAAGPERSALLHAADVEIDEAAFRAVRDGHEIALTTTEFRLLCDLARHPGQVLTRDRLLDLVWGYGYLGDSRLVDVAVQRLRAKVDADPTRPRLITTVRGVGYRLERG